MVVVKQAARCINLAVDDLAAAAGAAAASAAAVALAAGAAAVLSLRGHLHPAGAPAFIHPKINMTQLISTFCCCNHNICLASDQWWT